MYYATSITLKDSGFDAGKTCPVKENCLVASRCMQPGWAKNPLHHRRTLEKGGLVWCDDCESDCILVIHAGLAAISWYSPEGREKILRILGKGQTIGYETLFTPTQHPAVLRACTELEVCQYPKAELERLMGDDRGIAKRVLNSLSEYNVILEQQVKLLSIASASERVKLGLFILARQLDGKGQNEMELPLTNNDLSALIGLNRVTISRALKELEDQGLVKRGHGALTLHLEQLKWAINTPSELSELGFGLEERRDEPSSNLNAALEMEMVIQNRSLN